MLFGKSSKKPNIKTIRRIKATLHETLQLPEDVIVTVAELMCLEEDCSPIETVFGLLDPNAPQKQHKVHKAIEDLDSKDLMRVCTAWGFDIQISDIESTFNPTRISRR